MNNIIEVDEDSDEASAELLYYFSIK